MALHDISMGIHEDMMVYKNKDGKRPHREVILEYADHGINESRMLMDLHTGTHMDAPFHMIDGGGTAEDLDISKLIRKALVLDFTSVEDRITAVELKNREIPRNSFILLKTRNSYADKYDNDFVFLEETGARYLESLGIDGVGIDSLGIERSQPGHGTHKALLGSGIIIIEGLRLGDVGEGEYKMYALPLKILGADGAPARVILEDI